MTDEKKYNSLDELKKDWYTTKELYDFLSKEGFKSNIHTLKRWEEAGVIPLPKRANLKNLQWRVYNKDGSDFVEILEKLSARSSRVVNMTTKL